MTQINTTNTQTHEIDFNAWRIQRKQEQSRQDAVNRQLSENRHQEYATAN